MNSDLSTMICLRSGAGLGAASGLTDFARGIVACMRERNWKTRKKVETKSLEGRGRKEERKGRRKEAVRRAWERAIKRDFCLAINRPFDQH